MVLTKVSTQNYLQSQNCNIKVDILNDVVNRNRFKINPALRQEISKHGFPSDIANNIMPGMISMFLALATIPINLTETKSMLMKSEENSIQSRGSQLKDWNDNFEQDKPIGIQSSTDYIKLKKYSHY